MTKDEVAIKMVVHIQEQKLSGYKLKEYAEQYINRLTENGIPLKKSSEIEILELVYHKLKYGIYSSFGDSVSLNESEDISALLKLINQLKGADNVR